MWVQGRYIKVVSNEEQQANRENRVSRTTWGGFRLHSTLETKGVQYDHITHSRGGYWKASQGRGKFVKWATGATPQEALAALMSCRNHK